MTIRERIEKIPDRFLNFLVGILALVVIVSSVSTAILLTQYIRISNVHAAASVKRSAVTDGLLNSHTEFFNGLNAFERTAVGYFNNVDSTLTQICAKEGLVCNISPPFTLPPAIHHATPKGSENAATNGSPATATTKPASALRAGGGATP